MKILTNQLLIIGLLTIGSCTTQSEKGHEVIPPTFKMTTEIPEGILTPDQVETSIGILEYFDGVPSKTTSENVYDYLDRMRGVDAFLKGMPGASVRGLIMGIIEAGADEVNKVLFTEKLLDSRSLFLTANTSTVYISPNIDLKENGPEREWTRSHGNASRDAGSL